MTRPFIFVLSHREWYLIDVSWIDASRVASCWKDRSHRVLAWVFCDGERSWTCQEVGVFGLLAKNAAEFFASNWRLADMSESMID